MKETSSVSLGFEFFFSLIEIHSQSYFCGTEPSFRIWENLQGKFWSLLHQMLMKGEHCPWEVDRKVSDIQRYFVSSHAFCLFGLFYFWMKAYSKMNCVFRLIIIDAVFYSSVTMFVISFYRSFIVIPISFLAKTLTDFRAACSCACGKLWCNIHSIWRPPIRPLLGPCPLLHFNQKKVEVCCQVFHVYLEWSLDVDHSDERKLASLTSTHVERRFSCSDVFH